MRVRGGPGGSGVLIRAKSCDADVGIRESYATEILLDG
jgi:hypothetical protein